MGNDEHGSAQIIDLLQQGHDLVGTGRVQVTGRLVSDNRRGVVHQRAGNGQALLLTTGQLAGMATGLIAQAHQIQHIGNTLPDLPGAGTHYAHSKGHVFIHRHILDQPEVLKHDAHGTAQIRNLTPADMLQVIAINMDLTGRRF